MLGSKSLNLECPDCSGSYTAIATSPTIAEAKGYKVHNNE